jgi:SHS2 domain-containing protein
MTHPPWEEVEHTADVALRVRGATLAELFANAARGMLNLALGGEPAPAGRDRTEISLSAPDPETLLVDWLTELVYRMEDEAFIPSCVSVQSVEENTLRAEVTGGAGGTLSRHIKAVTYHDLSIQQTEGGFQATIVFDV